MAQRIILLVDGDLDSRAIFCAILRHRGYEVLETHDGVEGLRHAQTAMPDLIILEFPVLLSDGRTLTETLKQHPSTSAIPILTITSRAFEDELALARQAGADACLTKPVGPRRVLKEVERLIGPPLVSSHY